MSSVTATPLGLTISGETVLTGIAGPNTAVGFALSGGSSGVTYIVTISIMTALGHQFTRSAYVGVQQR
ncbi:MAG: phage fiber-tail adaptor protein [Acidiferrobacteraceae bacterium]